MAESEGERARPASSTHGYLFADLRGYTAYLDRHGAIAAADLLAHFRDLVRAAVGNHRGAEIRTEGDSFYVVFPSASTAVACALDIAVEAAGHDPEAIPVGIGVHAGESVDTPEGPVGTAVNIAARLCALAAPGEVLVSDTVRALIRSVGSAAFVPAGRRRLKGIPEPVAVYRATPAGTATRRSGAQRPRARLVAGGAVVAGVLATAILFAVQTRPAGGARSTPGPSLSASVGASVGSAASSAVSPAPSRTPRVLGVFRSVDFGLPFEITLGRDWTRVGEQADLAVFYHPEPPTGWIDVLLVEAVLEPPCRSSTPQFAIGDRPAGLIDWLTTRSWLDSGQPEPYNVGPYPGRAVPVTVLPGDRWTCDGRPGSAVAQFFRLGGGAGAGRLYGAEIGEQKFVVAIDVGGRTVTLVSGSPFEDVEDFWELAKPLLQSIRFVDR